jgi:hypothetical protein
VVGHAHDRRAGAAHRAVGPGQQRGDAARRARAQAELAQRQVADVLRMEAVDVLARVDAVDEAGRVATVRQGQLDQDAVHLGIGVEPVDQRQQLLVGGVRGQVVVDGANAHFSAARRLFRT